MNVRGPDQPAVATVRARVRFGVLKHEWIQDSFVLDASEQRDIPIVIPAAAFLHDLSDSYVSDLTVELWIGDGVDEAMERVLHGRYVAWPSGEAGSPVVWTRDEMAVNAPHGVLDVSLAAALPAGMPAHARILPPVTRRIEDRTPQPDISAADMEVTTFVDDQSDEGGQ